MVKISARAILKDLSNIPDWKTKRRIVVIESDDWGTLRMPSMEAFRRLEEAGLELRKGTGEAERFNMNDNLATSEDLEMLYEVLSSVKDSKGNPAVFTPICIMANPDFKKIEASGFQDYFYEPFTETLKRTPGCEDSFSLWNEGIEKKLFVPELHGREHLNVSAWMGALRSGDKQALLAFKEGVWGFIPESFPAVSYLAAFQLADPGEIEYQKTIIQEGAQLFEELLGYKALFFVPPNGVFKNSLNQTLAENGIQFRSTSKIQIESLGMGKTKKRLHYHGQKDKYGIRYIVRNCVFEPNKPKIKWVDNCLRDIDSAFQWHKPAILSTHRVSYVGALHPENRERGLKQLSSLLKEIVKRWPDVEFMTTAQLGALMNHK